MISPMSETSAEALDFQLPLSPEVTEPPGAPTLYTAETLTGMLDLAELTLSPEWQGKLLDTLNDLQPAVNRLRSLDLGETPPATAFDARWS
jgi:hypothetical protein